VTERKRSDDQSRSLSRAWTAPVRAVSRIWTSDGSTATGTPTPHRSAIVDCALYVDGVRQPGTRDYAQALTEARQRDNAFVWLGLHEPTDLEMSGVAAAYGLHELAAEDAVTGGQRPKLEHFGDVSFLAMRTARYVGHGDLTETTEVVETGQLMLFIGAQQDLMRHGPWAVAYAVCDAVVDLYIDVGFAVEQDLDAVEEDVFSRNAGGIGRIQRIYQLKRELVEFKRAVVPLQRPLNTLVTEQSDVPREVKRYFRDVQDHLTRTVEQVAAFDDLLNSILQARLAQVTVDQNNDMRKIAAWAGIAAVWTAIAGVYGMNFTYMPELDWRYGYPVVLALMLGASLVLYRFFRRAGWL
jgi:magnesium transporter